jgi:hypothetical protein
MGFGLSLLLVSPRRTGLAIYARLDLLKVVVVVVSFGVGAGWCGGVGRARVPSGASCPAGEAEGGAGTAHANAASKRIG